MKKVAIIGAGFVGLAAAFHLASKSAKVTVFDKVGVGGGASGVASGLLHPFPGLSSHPPWMAFEGMQEANNLLNFFDSSIASRRGILKIAVTPRQKKAFYRLSLNCKDATWLSPSSYCSLIDGPLKFPALYIKSGVTVDSVPYLNGIWKLCYQMGCKFERKKVFISDLGEFDDIVVAAGAGINRFSEANFSDLKYTKGQVLICERPKNLVHSLSLIGRGYLALIPNSTKCTLGATYEESYESKRPCLETAKKRISYKSKELFSLSSFKISSCLAGIRVKDQASSRPRIIKKGKAIFITALGSRGLLYHGYLGKQVAKEIIG